MILPFDRDAEKPLLPFTQTSTPNGSRPTSPPSSPYLLIKPPNVVVWRTFISGRRRLLLIVGFVATWFLLFGAWIRPPFGERRLAHIGHGRVPWDQVWRGWRHREDLDRPEWRPKKATTGATPLTELGTEADGVFSVGETDPEAYQKGLEDFIRRHFPSADSDETDPDSLINAMRAYFPSSDRNGNYPPVPNKLWQTAATEEAYAVKAGSRNSFEYHNAGINITFHDNERADEWVRQRFDMGEEDGGGGLHGVLTAWDRLAHPPVLRSDLWRYLVLATEGGIYADTDIECKHNLRDWGPDLSWNNVNPEDYVPPSLIVGIEADVLDRHDWHLWWPRPLQFTQWTIASARGHPVLIDVTRRVVEHALGPKPTILVDAVGRKVGSVMERTGPGPFTDAVLAYLFNKWDKTWADMRRLTQDGWRFRETNKWKKTESYWGDMKVLSITGFSPGVGHMGSEEPNHPAAMAQHLFAGSWRDQEGAGD